MKVMFSLRKAPRSSERLQAAQAKIKGMRRCLCRNTETWLSCQVQRFQTQFFLDRVVTAREDMRNMTKPF